MRIVTVLPSPSDSRGKLFLDCKFSTIDFRSMPLARWILLGLLLLAELLVLSVSFDFSGYRTYHSSPHLGSKWWEFVLWHAHNVIRFSIVAATATLLLSKNLVKRPVVDAAGAGRFSQPYRLWLPLLAHCTAFVALYCVTAQVLAGNLWASSRPGHWIALWLVTGFVAITLWLAAALPVNAWVPLARSAVRPLLIGATAALTAGLVGWLTRQTWRPLSQVTLWTVDRLITLSGADPIIDPARMMIGTQRFSVEIAPQCSGYEGIGLIWVFLAAYVWLYRRSLRFPHIFLLFPIGTLLIWLLNALRIAALIGIGTSLSPAIALGGFHSYSGWLLFCGATLGLVAAAQRSQFFIGEDVLGETVALTNPTAVYLAPLVTLLAVTMVTGAFSAGGFDALYPLRVVAVGAVLWFYRREHRSWRWTGSLPALVAGIATFALWIALESTRTRPDSSPLAAGLAGLPAGVAALWLVFRIVGSVVTVPIAEELAFRGYLMRRLIAPDFEKIPFRQFSWLAFLGSSLLFGAMHQRLVAGTLAGSIYALVLLRRGELSDAVLAHVTTNALLAAYVLITGSWDMWS